MNMHFNLRDVTILMVALSLLASSQACGNKSKSKRSNDPPTYEDGVVTVRRQKGARLRRSAVEVTEEAPSSITPVLDGVIHEEVFEELNLDASDDIISVIEWSIEGGLLREFWALVTDHDTDGDEVISKDEFEHIPVRITYA